MTSKVLNNNMRARVVILEQPAKRTRFRYECEGKSAGILLGSSSNASIKTFPTIKIINHTGEAFVVVSCVTKNAPFRPHPHNLIEKIKEPSDGICSAKIIGDQPISFQNVSVQCVKIKNIFQSLSERERLRVDPFKTGYDHKLHPESIDLSCVRLCFQAFIKGSTSDKFCIPLEPVVTDPIYDKKKVNELKILEISEYEAPVVSNKELCILCEKITKYDIQVRFYSEKHRWETQFLPHSYHKQVAIIFKCPEFFDKDISEPVEVKIQMIRPSTNEVSNSISFTYTPLNQGNSCEFEAKRMKLQECSGSSFPKPLKVETEQSKEWTTFDPETSTHFNFLRTGQQGQPSTSFINENTNENFSSLPYPQQTNSANIVGSKRPLTNNTSTNVFKNNVDQKHNINHQLRQNPEFINNNLLKNQEHLPNFGEPKVEIVEQPSSKGTRFRYESEGRFNNTIYGESGKNTYPTIRVLNYRGPLSVFISCVTKDAPFYPHPHKLALGNHVQENGVCFFHIKNNEHDITFQNLSIQCITKKNIQEVLTQREKTRIDPFQTGYGHKFDPKNIDLSCLRLCFQVILETPNDRILLNPIVSEPVYDKKTTPELEICWYGPKSGFLNGKMRMFILCEKISKKDIQVRFFDEQNGWEAIASDLKVYKQVVIKLIVPEYKPSKCNIEDITAPVKVKIQLRSIAEKKTSAAVPFEYLPFEYLPIGDKSLKRKRKLMQGSSGELNRRLQAQVLLNPNAMNMCNLGHVNRGPQEPQPSTDRIKSELGQLTSGDNISAQQQFNYSQMSNHRSQFGNNQNTTIRNTVANNQTQYNIPLGNGNNNEDEQKNSDTFSFGSWLTEFFNEIDDDPRTTNAAPYQVAPEPDIRYIVPTSSVSNNYGNSVICNNVPYTAMEQTDINSLENFLKGTPWANEQAMSVTNLNQNMGQANQMYENNDELRRYNIQQLRNSLDELYNVSRTNGNFANQQSTNQF